MVRISGTPWRRICARQVTSREPPKGWGLTVAVDDKSLSTAWAEFWLSHTQVCMTSDNEPAHHVSFDAAWEARQPEIDEARRTSREASRIVACLIQQLGGAVLIEDRTYAKLSPTAELRIERNAAVPGRVISVVER